MGISCRTSMPSIAAILKKEANRVDRLTVRALSKLGEDCVTRIRDRREELNWDDETGNLRSSIGYIVSKSGEIVTESDFKQVLSGSEGSTKGRELAEDLASKAKDPYNLTIVAGMNYASYVEAKKNKNVLASTELWARAETPGILRKLKEQIMK